MRISLKQTLNHIISIVDGKAKRERVSALQEEIVKYTIQVEISKGDSSYIHRLNHLSALQNRHLNETGHYHSVGNYAKLRRYV